MPNEKPDSPPSLPSTDTVDHEITRLLGAWDEGDAQARDRLVDLVYADLHRIAERHFRKEPRGHTLQPTALVNELYVKLALQHSVPTESRGAFFLFVAEQVRRILVDHARRRHSVRRGGGTPKMPLDQVLLSHTPPEQDETLLALSETLDRFKKIDPRAYKVVELHIFGGRTHDESAAMLDISRSTVHREWTYGQHWLARELRAR